MLALLGAFLIVTNVLANFSALRWSIAVTLAIAILGLNIVTGYSGQISVGHSAFFGIGAYTTMILVADHGWPFLATLPVAGALGFAVGFVLGIPALRIRGLYLALITLGLALAFPAIVKSDNFFGIDFAAVTGGSNGMSITGGDVTSVDGFSWAPPSWAPDSWSTNDWIFTTVFVIALVLFALTSNLIRSRVGRGLVAMRDNETGAAVSGVYPAQYKILAFATSAFVTSIGGGCFSLAVTTIGPDTFGLQRSIEFIAGLVIGGVATILGPAIGGVLVEWLPVLGVRDRLADPRPPRGSRGGHPLRHPARPDHLLHARRDRLRAAPAALEVHADRAPAADAERSDHDRGRRSRSRRGAGGGAGGDVDADFTFGPGVCPNIHTGPSTTGGNNQ